jgi:hypothetical protein
MLLMQASGVTVEFAFQSADLAGELSPLLRVDRLSLAELRHPADLGADRPEDRLAISLGLAYLYAEISQSGGLKPLHHHASSGLFLADHQDRPTVGEGVGDNVDDRLRFARPRRTVDDQTWMLAGLPDDPLL